MRMVMVSWLFLVGCGEVPSADAAPEPVPDAAAADADPGCPADMTIAIDAYTCCQGFVEVDPGVWCPRCKALTTTGAPAFGWGYCVDQVECNGVTEPGVCS